MVQKLEGHIEIYSVNKNRRRRRRGGVASDQQLTSHDMTQQPAAS